MRTISSLTPVHQITGEAVSLYSPVDTKLLYMTRTRCHVPRLQDSTLMSPQRAVPHSNPYMWHWQHKQHSPPCTADLTSETGQPLGSGTTEPSGADRPGRRYDASTRTTRSLLQLQQCHTCCPGLPGPRRRVILPSNLSSPFHCCGEGAAWTV